MTPIHAVANDSRKRLFWVYLLYVLYDVLLNFSLSIGYMMCHGQFKCIFKNKQSVGNLEGCEDKPKACIEDMDQLLSAEKNGLLESDTYRGIDGYRSAKKNEFN